ncbi:AraC family transcriptional regulator [Shewanella surugensis]|uniref:AraC family transcriptional regulator n=1 Tax=Shewanella surugensis TaxID=212020 RepID=A0ABT0LAI3_9GAMM|nr:GyrI-like domain-containing protein [Shewanella surugensis]MCL1124500.1 AraC family transcriptional regulator [Shewanella surugensis]
MSVNNEIELMVNQERIRKATDYIDTHFDEEISLEQLSQLVHLSQYHFHRLFTAINGLPLHQYVRWLKLKRAANQLLFDKDKSILEIALFAGFESHEAFTRAFKVVCLQTPSQFRRASQWLHWERIPYLSIEKDNTMIEPNITLFEGARLAVIEHRGSPSHFPQSIAKLVNWAKENQLGQPKASEVFTIAYGDPKTTQPALFRCDIGRVITEDRVLGMGMIEKRLPSGRVAIARHLGSHDNIEQTVYGMYQNWLPSTKEELLDYPCVFCYQNYVTEVPESALKTDIYFFLKD